MAGAGLSDKLFVAIFTRPPNNRKLVAYFSSSHKITNLIFMTYLRLKKIESINLR